MNNYNNSDKPVGRFLSADECSQITKRSIRLTDGRGSTTVSIDASWTGNIRWSRNEIISSGDTRDNKVMILRNINGANYLATLRQLSDRSLSWAIARAERLLQFRTERPDDGIVDSYVEPYQIPKIWYDSTFNLSSSERAKIVDNLIKPAEENGLVAAGYIQISGHGRSVSLNGIEPIYVRYTKAQISVTVRDQRGMGSGWAGVDWNDWNQIDGLKITQTAIDKCLKSRNPLAVEPGRYNVVLEPQAVHDIVKVCFSEMILDRQYAEDRAQMSPYSGIVPGTSKIGLRLFDERITVTTDPMDPLCLDTPVLPSGAILNRAVWVDRGILKNLAYNRKYGIQMLGVNNGLPSNSSYSMSGGMVTVDDMIDRTERGLFVTRFSDIMEINRKSLLMTGYTRDGLWLIERGKLTKAVKNMRFTESPFHTLNNIVQLGIPQRVFSPEDPAVAPAIMSKDFSFTATINAI